MGMIVLSRQFREIRGAGAPAEHTAHGRSVGDRHASNG
jgi:hypothetical protein